MEIDICDFETYKEITQFESEEELQRFYDNTKNDIFNTLKLLYVRKTKLNNPYIPTIQYKDSIFSSPNYKNIIIEGDCDYKKIHLSLSTYNNKIIWIRVLEEDRSYRCSMIDTKWIEFRNNYGKNWYGRLQKLNDKEYYGLYNIRLFNYNNAINLSLNLKSQIKNSIAQDKIKDKTIKDIVQIENIITLISESEGYSEENKKLILKESNDRIRYLKQLEKIELDKLKEE